TTTRIPSARTPPLLAMGRVSGSLRGSARARVGSRSGGCSRRRCAMRKTVDLEKVAEMVERARGNGHADPNPHGPPKIRTPIRLPCHDVARLDNLRARMPVPPGERRPSRAAVVRAFVALGLDMAGEPMLPKSAPTTPSTLEVSPRERMDEGGGSANRSRDM